MKEKVYSARSLYQSIAQQIHQRKPDMYNIEEARYMAMMLMEHFLHQRRNDILLDRTLQIDSHQENSLEVAITRICHDEPIQYVIGETFFYGRPLFVSSSVLVPRRETEELTDIIIKENKQANLDILDIGTGSGCIAITLYKELEEANVYALDASQEALAVAKGNAQRHQAEIHWLLDDILSPATNLKSYDIVVSNPPYVRKSEATGMKKNVLDFEPHEALFVSDDDPLLFYWKIVALCKQGMLKENGKVYLEINEAYGKELVNLLEQQGFKDVVLRKDMQQRDRFVLAKLTF